MPFSGLPPWAMDIDDKRDYLEEVVGKDEGRHAQNGDLRTTVWLHHRFHVAATPRRRQEHFDSSSAGRQLKKQKTERGLGP